MLVKVVRELSAPFWLMLMMLPAAGNSMNLLIIGRGAFHTDIYDLGSAGHPTPQCQCQWLVPPPPPPLWRGVVRDLGLLGFPLPLWCGVVRGLGLLSVPPVWCGSGSGRPGCFEIVVIIIVIIIVILIGILIMIIIMMFISWVNCHRKRARQERLLVTAAFSIPSWQSPG